MPGSHTAKSTSVVVPPLMAARLTCSGGALNVWPPPSAGIGQCVCTCGSMPPGMTSLPVASMMRAASPDSVPGAATATMRSPSMPTSQVPTPWGVITCPPRITRSSMVTLSSVRLLPAHPLTGVRVLVNRVPRGRVRLVGGVIDADAAASGDAEVQPVELPRRCPVELRAEASGHRNAEAAIARGASDHVLRRAIRRPGRRRRRRVGKGQPAHVAAEGPAEEEPLEDPLRGQARARHALAIVQRGDPDEASRGVSGHLVDAQRSLSVRTAVRELDPSELPGDRLLRPRRKRRAEHLGHAEHERKASSTRADHGAWYSRWAALVKHWANGCSPD